jgi:class 3 adenylate cyclase/uncharacterized protein YndB with AHSA1/START domain
MRGTVTLSKEVVFDRPPAEVWRFATDTSLINELIGSPAYTVEESVDADGSVHRHARGSMGPLKVEWDEEFGEWVKGHRLQQKRHFRNGPVEDMQADFVFTPEGAGTRLNLGIRIDWRGPLGAMMNWAGMYKQAIEGRCAAIQRLIAESGRPESDWGASEATQVTGPARERLDALLAKLGDDPHAHGLADRLAEHLLHAPALAVRRIRPLALAHAWGALPDAVIELCLAAHRDGILSLSWELLCPRCRGAKFRTTQLDELPRGTHCSSCNIDYERNFHRNVELTFRAERWLRPVPEGEFCMLGPSTTPHVILQREVAAGAAAEFDLTLGRGHYRFRTVEAGGEADIEVNEDGRIPTFIVGNDGISAASPGTPRQVRIRNESRRPLLCVIEEREWVRDALTGDRVVAMPAFRQLCPEQLLRPGDDVEIERVTILFTDLKGSTAMYSVLGDATAYGLVREHFAFLAERIQGNHGAVVKTVGDSVMAVFHDAVDAVRAALSVQADVAAFNADRKDETIILKLGLHQGPCIAVTTAGVLDYFGTTVNTAARLERLCTGGDIVFSAAVVDDPLAAALLAARNLPRETAVLRGIDRPVTYARLTA